MSDKENVAPLSPKKSRKRFKSPDERREWNLKKYPLLAPCKMNCRLNCNSKLSEESRSEIRHSFRSLDFAQKRLWLNSYVTLLGVKRRSKTANSNVSRNFSVLYTLPLQSGGATRVCKTIFLAIIGATCDSIVTEFIKSRNCAPVELTTKKIEEDLQINQSLIIKA